jgi:hypothetical protein
MALRCWMSRSAVARMREASHTQALSEAEWETVRRFGLHEHPRVEHVRAMRRGFLLVVMGVVIVAAAVVGVLLEVAG